MYNINNPIFVTSLAFNSLSPGVFTPGFFCPLIDR